MPCTTINLAPKAITSRRARSSAASDSADTSTPTTTRRGSDAGRDADWFIVVTLSGRMGDARIAGVCAGQPSHCIGPNRPLRTSTSKSHSRHGRDDPAVPVLRAAVRVPRRDQGPHHARPPRAGGRRARHRSLRAATRRPGHRRRGCAADPTDLVHPRWRLSRRACTGAAFRPTRSSSAPARHPDHLCHRRSISR